MPEVRIREIMHNVLRKAIRQHMFQHMCLCVFWCAHVLVFVLHVCLRNIQWWKDANKIIRISHK